MSSRSASTITEEFINNPNFNITIFPKRLQSIVPYADFNKAIATICEDFGGSYLFEKFNEKLIECEAYIAGSYILQVLHQEKYEDSDIDIFCPINKLPELLSFFHNHGAVSLPGDENPCHVYKTRIPVLEKIFDIQFRNKKIQILGITTGCSKNDLFKFFDLSFCEASWDGKVIYPEEQTKQLENIMNRNGVYNEKQLEYKEGRIVVINICRIRKYLKRGYSITF